MIMLLNLKRKKGVEMNNIELKDGQIFEVSHNTTYTYFYGDGKIIEITPQEFNIINILPPEERVKVLKLFRWTNNF